MNLKYELQSIISGTSKNSTRDIIEAAAHHLGKGKETGGNSQTNKLSKDQETAQLISWIEANGL